MKILMTSLCSLMVLCCISCTDWLDIRPEGEMILEEYWQSLSDVEAVVTGCYSSLTDQAMIERYIVWGEVRSDNVEEFTKDDKFLDLFRIMDGELNASNGYCNWSVVYKTINYCNTVLNYAPNVMLGRRELYYTKVEHNKIGGADLTCAKLFLFDTHL